MSSDQERYTYKQNSERKRGHRHTLLHTSQQRPSTSPSPAGRQARPSVIGETPQIVGSAPSRRNTSKRPSVLVKESKVRQVDQLASQFTNTRIDEATPQLTQGYGQARSGTNFHSASLHDPLKSATHRFHSDQSTLETGILEWPTAEPDTRVKSITSHHRPHVSRWHHKSATQDDTVPPESVRTTEGERSSRHLHRFFDAIQKSTEYNETLLNKSEKHFTIEEAQEYYRLADKVGNLIAAPQGRSLPTNCNQYRDWLEDYLHNPILSVIERPESESDGYEIQPPLLPEDLVPSTDESEGDDDYRGA